jgi:4-amino-4-deoxy-L-arabinose transferase-like glycosyltransferase
MAIGHARPAGRVKPAVGDWLAALVIALAVLATRGVWFGDAAADFDEQLYSFIGWRMTHGDLPYVEVWDRKPFGLFAIFAFAHWLFGPGAIAYQALGCLASFVGALFVYALARELVDRVSATVAAMLYVILLAVYGSFSGQTEEFHTPIMLAMLWLVRDPRRADAPRRATAAMLLGGLALQIKYTVLPQCLFFGTYALYGEWRGGARPARLAARALLFAVLGVLPTVLVGVLYAWWGHFAEFWFANFVSFFERLPASTGRLRPDLAVAILPLALLLALGLYAAFRLNPPRNWRIYGLYAAWTVAALATVLMPGTVYLYYYATMAAPAALLALPVIDVRSPARFLPAATLLITAGYVINLPGDYARANADRRAEEQVTAAIAPYVGAKRDCLYVFDGPTVLYRTTGSCLPSRFVYPDHLNNALETRALGIDQTAEVARILANRPGVIVTAAKPVTRQRAENLKLVHDAIRSSYGPLLTTVLQGREITAWVRRDLVTARSSPVRAPGPSTTGTAPRR